ncbi:MAG: hypothetical protein IPF92_17105 [Myxococcales bacterium]|nr:hypothetical protein [Myxococcales bacterium]
MAACRLAASCSRSLCAAIACSAVVLCPWKCTSMGISWPEGRKWRGTNTHTVESV